MEITSLRTLVSELRGSEKLQNLNSLASCSDRYLANKILDIGLKFIKQQTDKRKLWNSSNIFTSLDCVQMKQVPLSECGGYNADILISRSVYKLPRIAEGNNFGMLIQGIYSIDFPSKVSRRFIESTIDRFANSLNLKLKTKQIHFWLQNDYLYISDDSIQKLKVIAYFEEDVSENLIYYPSYCTDNNSNTTNTSGCCADSATIITTKETTNINDMDNCCPKNPLDLPHKLPGYLVADILKEVEKEMLETYFKLPEANTSGIPEAKK